MANPFKKSEKATRDVSVNQNPIILTAPDFFIEGTGYWGKDEFLTWGESARDQDVEELGKYISLRKDGKKVIKTSTSKVDAGGNPYKYVTFLLSSDDKDGVKVPQVGGWVKFLEDDLNGKIKIDFTLNDLIAEARKA